jgi:ABC-2 type transport system permease protein
MNPIFTLAKKELRELFASPIAYVFIAVFLFLSFWLYFSNIFLIGEATIRPFFAWTPVLFIVFLPSVTMGKWAEERKSGTLELIATLPVEDWQLVAGKLLSTLFFLAIVLVFTLPLPLTVSGLGELDLGQVIGSYLGIFLLGASYLALGLFISSLTQNQIVAFLVTTLVLFLLFVLAEPIVTNYLPRAVVPAVQFMSFSSHFESMARGVLDSRDVVYFFSMTGLFAYLNLVSLNMRKVS